jgi:hypothetical protein
MIGAMVTVLVLTVSGSTRIEPLRIPLTACDAENHKHTLYFGFHPQATYGFDSWLGEAPIPPVPAVPAFDVRFLDPVRQKQFAGDGAYVDIRHFSSRGQTDTFFVYAQPANRSFPLTFSWPEGLGRTFGTIVLKYEHAGSSRVVDMTTQTSFAIEEDGPASFTIITSGLKGKLPWNN